MKSFPHEIWNILHAVMTRSGLISGVYGHSSSFKLDKKLFLIKSLPHEILNNFHRVIHGSGIISGVYGHSSSFKLDKKLFLMKLLPHEILNSLHAVNDSFRNNFRCLWS